MTADIATLARAANIELPAIGKARKIDAKEEAAHLDAIAKAADPTRAREAYARWLAEAGDPLGLLALVRSAHSAMKARETAMFEKHAEALVGSLATYIDKKWIDPTWERGFIDAVDISVEEPMGVTGSDVLQALLDHPSAHLLRDIRISGNREAGGWRDNYQPLIDTLVETRKPRALRHLSVSGVYGSPCGDVSAVWAAFPELTGFEAHGESITLGEIDAPNLDYLRVDLMSPTVETIQAMTSATAPKLETLILPPIDVTDYLDALAPIFDDHFPKLKTLALYGPQHAEVIVKPLLASPLVKRLEQFSLWNTRLPKAAADKLAKAFGKRFDKS